MTTEYSIDVENWQDERWEQVGADLMYDYYLNDKEIKEEAKANNWELEDHAREKADENYPMMNYAYPLEGEPDDEKIIEVCKRTNCTVVKDSETETYYLALTGGGTDLSQDIALAYLIAEGSIPFALVNTVSTQPELSIHGKDWLEMARRCKKELAFEIRNAKDSLKKWNDAIREYNRRKKEEQTKKDETQK